MHNNESKEDLSRSSRRGKFHTTKYSPNEVRTHCVSVRLNEEELSILDSKRGAYKKGEWLRMASLNKIPPVLPEINREAWTELGRLAQYLNHLLTHLDHKSSDSELSRTELFAVRRQIKALREHLIPSTFWSGNK
ncbi:ATP-binding protein [Salmonella enterica]|uniref:ATP-binding protein n=1 Tax=Salmonella muenchen TaxID=596 RepID=A0A614NKQ2_SALMU|nr:MULTISPECIES: ATP-binding protein [Enterobacteriaceae]EBX5007245.1 ATP-binding protein [Salmonella enterica subsp. enterica serovar Sarajane]ECA5369956.1 ATP-binding protein [Salmonella enterica subsp. enterica serovar Give]ECO7058103.1 ATP-binding protein [Salmonella enterica subsp. enterica]EDX3649399.1 ATP-binding protein [Salmonella enterica subsp. enterica serovar O rough]EHF9334849.1 ATP-binding protein [Salmonella enterica subsp. enterica serovar 4,[5],12:b:-]MCL5520865.1 ATP-bindin